MAMMTTRRRFLKVTSGAAMGLYLSPLACESNLVNPKLSGSQFDFLTPVDPSTARADRAPGSHFVQFGAEGSVDGWRYEDINPITLAEWQLQLTGAFTTPTTLTAADLQSEVDNDQDVTLLNTLRCIFDDTSIPGLVGTSLWRGVPLARFLEQAGVDPSVRRFRFFGRDGFNNNLLREEVLVPAGEPELAPLLAVAVNGEDIPHIHGGPVRLVVPGKYGYKNLKWVDRIEATADDTVFGSYQEVFQFFDEGTIQLATKVTNPLARASLPAGPVELFGYALSGAASVQGVEIAIDDGPFEPAQLQSFDDLVTLVPELTEVLQVELERTYPFRSVWTLFTFNWDATPGPHRLRFRATDSAGEVQAAIDEDPTDGSSGYWDIDVDVT